MTSEKLNWKPSTWPVKASISSTSESRKPKSRPTPSSPAIGASPNSTWADGSAATTGASRTDIANRKTAFTWVEIPFEEKIGAKTINPLKRTATSTMADK